MSTLFVFLQTVPQGGPKWSSYIFIILLIVIFWLFIIRPKKKKNQEKEQIPKQPWAKGISNQPDSHLERPTSHAFSFCPSCGSKLKEGAKFCTSCGNPVSTMGQNEPTNQQFSHTSPTQNSIQNITIKGKYLSGAQKIWNLVSENQLLDTFSYTNGMVLVKSQGGETIHAPLSQLSVYFEYNQTTEQRKATISYQGKEIEFIEAWASISEIKTITILNVLSKAGTVYGTESITPESIAKAKQIKAQQALTRFYMGQMLRR